MTETGQRALGMVLRVLLAAVALLLAALALDRASTTLILEVAGLLAVLAACLRLQRAGRAASAVAILVPALLGIATLACLDYGSVRSVGSTVMACGIVAAGLFLRRAAVAAAVAYAVLALGALIVAERAGLIGPPSTYQLTFVHWLALVVVMSCIGAWTHYARHLLLGALAAAKTSADRFAKVFGVAPVSIVISRASDGRILDVNPADERFLGYTRDEALRMTTMQTAWRDPAQRERLVETLRRDGIVNGFEARFHDKSGRAVDAQLWAAPVELGGERCIVTAALNVTERRREERLLLELAAGVAGASGEQVVPALVRHVAAALECEVAMLGELTGPGRARTLAAVREGAMLPPSDWRIAGAPCGDLPRDGEPRLIAAGVLERYPAAAQIVDRRVQSYIGALLRDADGRPIGLFSAYGFKPMQRTPRIEALFSIFAARAQSELRELRAERELRRMNEALEARVRERTADLESFTHSVAHDLRAPLRALSGLSSILQEDYAPALPPEVARYLTRIDVNARQMGRLVDDLLEFSRLGLVALKHGEVDMAALVEAKVQELRSQGAERVRFEIGDILPASGDRQLLGLVWSNLLDNAVKYSRHSAAPRVDVWSERCSAGLRYVVRDNGAGFDPRFAAKLFQVFERLHSASEFEGTGVGLAIVNRVVGRHGGSVAASGTPGGGATFSFVLPQALGAALPSAA